MNIMIENPSLDQINQLKNFLNNGEILSAAKKAQSIIKKYPNSFIIWNILGVSLYELGKIDGAIKSYKKAIKLNPSYAHAHINLALAFRVQGKLDKAIEYCEKAVFQNPDDAKAYNNLGALLLEQGKFEKAILACKKAILLQPDYADAHNNLGAILRDQGKFDQAIESFEKAITINPIYLEAYDNLGLAFTAKAKFDDAIKFFKKAISLDPDYADAYNDMGVVLANEGKFDEAMKYYKKAISINPKYAEPYINIGNLLKDRGNLNEAIDAYKKAIFLNPNNPIAHKNLSFLLLNNGKLKEGFDEYEWRWKTKQGLSRYRYFLKPQWDGKISLKGKTILLWCEQGIGDNINWSSCLSLVSARADHVILECHKKLVSLLSRSFPNVEVKAEDRSLDADRDDFDLHLPMGSIYKHFIDEIIEKGKPASYLIPCPTRVKYWRRRLKAIGNGPYIGVSWKSINTSFSRRQNYTSILEWSPVFNIPNVTFINLQYANHDDDIKKVKDEIGITIHNFPDIDQFANIDDVAALTAAVDMVVSTKITVPFISAGVGTPTKLINWRQSSWNNILLNPKGPILDIFERNTFETWGNVFKLVSKNLTKNLNKNNH